MAISASGVAQAIHAATHRPDTRGSAPMQRREQFQHHLAAAAGVPAAGAPDGRAAAQPPGGLLSADLLKSVQTMGAARG